MNTYCYTSKTSIIQSFSNFWSSQIFFHFGGRVIGLGSALLFGQQFLQGFGNDPDSIVGVSMVTTVIVASFKVVEVVVFFGTLK